MIQSLGQLRPLVGLRCGNTSPLASAAQKNVFQQGAPLLQVGLAHDTLTLRFGSDSPNNPYLESKKAIEKGLSAYRNGDFEKAYAHFHQGYSLLPETEDALQLDAGTLMARAVLRLGRVDMATGILESALAQMPKGQPAMGLVSAHHVLGKAYYASGRYTEAFEQLTEGLVQAGRVRKAMAPPKPGMEKPVQLQRAEVKLTTQVVALTLDLAQYLLNVCSKGESQLDQDVQDKQAALRTTKALTLLETVSEDLVKSRMEALYPGLKLSLLSNLLAKQALICHEMGELDKALLHIDEALEYTGEVTEKNLSNVIEGKGLKLVILEKLEDYQGVAALQDELNDLYSRLPEGRMTMSDGRELDLEAMGPDQYPDPDGDSFGFEPYRDWDPSQG